MRNQGLHILCDHPGYSAKMGDGAGGGGGWRAVGGVAPKFLVVGQDENEQPSHRFLSLKERAQDIQGSWVISELCHFFSLCNLPESQSPYL